MIFWVPVAQVAGIDETTKEDTMHIDWTIGIEDLPQECINDCSQPGSNDDAVAFWRNKLDLTVDREKAIKCLDGYGAWDGLEDWDDTRLAETVLWLAAHDFREFQVAGDSAGSDIFVLE